MKRRVLPRAQLVAARELLGWSRADAAERISLAASRVQEVELGRGTETSADRLTALYEANGVEFLKDGQVRMKTAAPE